MQQDMQHVCDHSCDVGLMHTVQHQNGKHMSFMSYSKPGLLLLCCASMLLDLVDFGVAGVFPDNQEICLATDAACHSPTMPFDVILSLATVQGV